MLLANVAWGTGRRWTPEWDSVKKPISEFNDRDWAGKFHVWRMDWDDKAIKLYVDDILLNTTDLKDTFNKNTEAGIPFINHTTEITRSIAYTLSLSYTPRHLKFIWLNHSNLNFRILRLDRGHATLALVACTDSMRELIER